MKSNPLKNKLEKLPTFEEITIAHGKFTTGFDYLRLGLSLSVLTIHVISIADTPIWVSLWTSWFAPFELSILPAFFALSGYLVAGSLLRNNIPEFLALRIIRLFPALVVEVFLCAFVLGIMVTKLPTGQYLTSPEFGGYLLNVVGYIHYTLPGVFEGRPINIQLWTIPFELECYVALVVLAAFGLIRRRLALFLIVTVTMIGMTFLAVKGTWYQAGWNVPGRMLVLSFLFGAIVYLFRCKIPYHPLLAAACGLSCYLFLSFPNLTFLAAAPLAYLTIYIGLLHLPPVPFGDLSYGIYLFHFPIARSIHEWAGRAISWEGLLFYTSVLTVVFASMSWNLIEKNVLGRKRQILAQLGRKID